MNMIADYPSGVGCEVAMRCPRGVDDVVVEEEGGCLFVIRRPENHVTGSIGTRSFSREGCLDFYRASGDFGTIGERQCMQALMINDGLLRSGAFAHRYEINRPRIVGFANDHRGGADANLRSYLIA